MTCIDFSDGQTSCIPLNNFFHVGQKTAVFEGNRSLSTMDSFSSLGRTVRRTFKACWRQLISIAFTSHVRLSLILSCPFPAASRLFVRWLAMSPVLSMLARLCNVGRDSAKTAKFRFHGKALSVPLGLAATYACVRTDTLRMHHGIPGYPAARS